MSGQSARGSMSPYKLRVGRVELWSRRLLLALYQAARCLSLLFSSLDLEQDRLQLKAPQQKRNRLLIIVWRSILVGIYWVVIPGIFTRMRSARSYADLFIMLQSSSVSIFAISSFVIQVRADSQFRAVLNQYIGIYSRVCALTKTEHLFPRKFPILYAIKFLLTLTGCLYELPQLLPLHYILRLDVGHIIGGLIAIYLWLGTLFLLDACFLGFLTSAILYEHMGDHIALMLRHMRFIDNDRDPEERGRPADEQSERDLRGCYRESARLSHYRKMCLLCDRADELEACGVIYTELYQVTLLFRCIFQRQIIFYIYYNLIVLLIMLYEYILNYLEGAQGELVPVVMICIKMANIVLLIMCADYMIKKSQMPQILPLDIVCSDIDTRWDKSVECFLGQLQAQKVEVKILGILQINNALIPTILSAIITYLFILLQFTFTGGFEVSKEIQRLNLTM